jgi:hypothetical protein
MRMLAAIGLAPLLLWALYETLIRRKNRLFDALLRDVAGALEEAGIEYWLNWGTLLGAWRHGRLLRHDTDIDLAVPSDQSSMALRAVTELARRKGYALGIGGSAAIVHLRRPGPWQTLRDCTHLDLEWYAAAGDRYLMRMHDKACTPASLVLPLSTVSLNGREYSAPHDPRGYLAHLYGYTGRLALFEGNNLYRRCRTAQDFARLLWNQAVFLPAYFLWKAMPLPRGWKRGGEGWLKRLAPYYHRVFHPAKI